MTSMYDLYLNILTLSKSNIYEPHIVFVNGIRFIIVQSLLKADIGFQ